VRAQLFGDGDAVQEAMGKMQSAMADHPELFAAAKQMADQIAQHAPGLDLGSFFGGGDLMQMAERMLGGLSGAEQDRLQKMAANTFEKLGGQEGVDAILNAGTAAGGPTNVKGKK
jgi:hypothetical protein